MITPRTTRLVRVAGLHAFRRAIRHLAFGTRQPEPKVIVPTRSAARLLGLGITRDDLYEELRVRLSDPPRRLSAIERQVIMHASARAVADAGAPLTFQLRPGLVAEMLRFYDQLKRQTQAIARFEELITGRLGGDEGDRGAARLRQQTRFLADGFREYERRVAASNACDEHTLRERLIAEAALEPIVSIVATVADWIADDNGLYVADFDLLARIPGLQSLDIVATENVLRSGFHERIHDWLPGIEETDVSGLGVPDSGLAKPVLVTPPTPESHIPNLDAFWIHRDREEELIAIARIIRANERRGEGAPLDRTAVVFKQPLPYLYLAPRVFGQAGLPVQMGDTLPLAAEPTAAAFDLVLDAAASDFNREAIVALLRSPHFAFGIDRHAASALDRFLSERRYLGGLDRVEPIVGDIPSLVSILRELEPLTSSRPASEQIRTVLRFWSSHATPLDDGDPLPAGRANSAPWGPRLASRERRARAAIVGALESLAAACAAQDDPAWTLADLSAAVRRAVEDQTFIVESNAAGIHAIDDQAARYGDFDDVAIVGLVENEWPEKPRRNIFYPPSLLHALGWPTERDRRAAADARFLDLLASASRRTMVSTFTLDDDALVMRSMQLDEIPRARLSTIAAEPLDQDRVFLDEALSREPVLVDRVAGVAREWALLRAGLPGADLPAFHGTIGALPARPWSVSALETYLSCPFRFFAQHVLALEEEPDDEEVIDPRRQGRLVHEVFEQFFQSWQAAGRAAITRADLNDARALFAGVVDRALESLSPAEAGLERTRLLGSAAAAGLGEAVFRMEAERSARVIERLLEHRLEGEFTFRIDGADRRLSLRGKADRIDLLDDGTFRLIDYKLGWPPDPKRALQLAIYSICAEQRLAGRHGRVWTLGEAAYLAFKGPRRVAPLFTASTRDKVLADAQQRLGDTIDRIAAGEFPPTPRDVFLCETCSFVGVCRKDYVGDV